MICNEFIVDVNNLLYFVLISDCRKKLCGCLEGLFHIYNKTVNGEDSFKVPAEDSLHLVEALR